MLLRWIAGFTLFGALTLSAHANEVDAPLPFDDPAAAPQIAKKKPAKAAQAAKKGAVKPGKKATKRTAIRHAKAPQKKTAAPKSGSKKQIKKKKR